MTRAFMNIAHRGASSYAPENTLAAYDKAFEMGIRHIELDVHFTSDNHIVVIHDDTVDRTTNKTGPVSRHSLSELRKMDAGSWFGSDYVGERIPTLEEVLTRYKSSLKFHIEIKARVSGLATSAIDIIKSIGVTDDVTITSFWKQGLDEARLYAPQISTGWLIATIPGGDWDTSIVQQSLLAGFTQVCPSAEIITPELIETLHYHGFIVRCHGISNQRLMRHVVDCGADGMTINFPDKLANYLKTKGKK